MSGNMWITVLLEKLTVANVVKKFSRLMWLQKFHRRVHKSPLLDTVRTREFSNPIFLDSLEVIL